MNKMLYLPLFLVVITCAAMEEEKVKTLTDLECSSEVTSVDDENSLKTADELIQETERLVVDQDKVPVLAEHVSDADIEKLLIAFNKKIQALESSLQYSEDEVAIKDLVIIEIQKIKIVREYLTNGWAHSFLMSETFDNKRLENLKICVDQYKYANNDEILPRRRVFEQIEALGALLDSLRESVPKLEREIEDFKDREEFWSANADKVLALMPDEVPIVSNNYQEDDEGEDGSDDGELTKEERCVAEALERKNRASNDLIQALGVYLESAKNEIKVVLKDCKNQQQLELNNEQNSYNQLLDLIKSQIKGNTIAVARGPQNVELLKYEYYQLLLEQQANALLTVASLKKLKVAKEEELQNRKDLIKLHIESHNKLCGIHESFTQKIEKNKKLRVRLMMLAPKGLEWDKEEKELKKQINDELGYDPCVIC